MNVFKVVTIVIICVSEMVYAASNIRLVASKSDLTKFLESAQAGPDAKLVFCEGGIMYFVDFSESAPLIQELSNYDDGIMPVISPDGKYIVYAKGVPDDGETTLKGSAFIGELTSTGTPVLVAEPAYVPRFVQNSNMLTVVYSTCASHPDASKFAYDGCGAVVRRSFSNSKISNPDTIWSGGSYFGGLSIDGRYLGTAWLGSGNAYILDLKMQNPKPVLTYLKLKNTQSGSDTIVQIGACQPSMSSSSIYPDAMMFVDFGNTTGLPQGYSSRLLPPAWQPHGILCISKSNGDLLKCIGQKYKPELSYEDYEALSWENTNGQSFGSVWDYPEWSNHPYLAAVSVAVERTWKGPTKDIFEDRSMGEYIYLINLKNETVLPLVSITDTARSSKTDLRWPWFWSAIPQGFSEQQAWLATGTKMPKIKQKEYSVKLSGNKIRSTKPISQVIVCDLNGRSIWSRCFSKATQNVIIPENLIRNKMVIVRVQTDRCFWSEFCSINAP
jgi:hypothetical protein